MYTHKTDNGTIFLYNSGLTGDVTIKRGGQEMGVPGKDILRLVAAYIRSEQIAQLEQATDEKILGLKEL